MYIPMEERNSSNPLYKRLRSIKDNMMARCYNPNNPKYINYGAKGVTVDKKWHKLEGFIEDADKIDGWDEDKFIRGELQLDKDLKIKGNKVYSKDTCTWVTQDQNVKVKPNAQREIVGISPDGEVYTFANQTEFAKEHNLYRVCIHDCLTGKAKTHKGWLFYYKGEKPKRRELFIAIKKGGGTGDIVEAYSQAELADKLGIPRKHVYNALRKGRNNEYGGYIFERTKDY